jgi:hypothetical protein
VDSKVGQVLHTMGFRATISGVHRQKQSVSESAGGRQKGVVGMEVNWAAQAQLKSSLSWSYSNIGPGPAALLTYQEMPELKLWHEISQFAYIGSTFKQMTDCCFGKQTLLPCGSSPRPRPAVSKFQAWLHSRLLPSPGLWSVGLGVRGERNYRYWFLDWEKLFANYVIWKSFHNSI